MTLSDTDYQHWLEQSASSERCMLVALESDAGMVRASWPSFINRPTDQYPNLAWDDVLSQLPEFNSVDGVVDIGDLEILWPGQINELFSRHWRGRQYRIWLGSQSWPMDDFRVIASGRIKSVQRTDAHRIKFVFLSAAVLLDKAISETAEEPTETMSLLVDSGAEPRDFDPVNSSIPLPARYDWKSPDVLFALPTGEDAQRPVL